MLLVDKNLIQSNLGGSSVVAKKGSKDWKKQLLQYYGMLLPNFLLFVLCTIYPTIWVLRYMFYNYSGFGNPVFCGFDNFVRLFTRDPDYWNTFLITFEYSAWKVLIVIPLSFLIAVIVNRPRKANAVAQAIIFCPTIMSAAVMALIFYLIFNTYNGDLNKFLLAAHIIKTPIAWLGAQNAMTTVLITAAWGALGNYMVYFLAGLQQIPNDVYESAELDGVNFWQRLWYITLPMLGPLLKIIMMLAIMAGFHDMQSIMVLTGGGPFGRTEVNSLYVYQLFFPLSSESGGATITEYGYGSVASVVSSAILGLLTVLYLKASKKIDAIY